MLSLKCPCQTPCNMYVPPRHISIRILSDVSNTIASVRADSVARHACTSLQVVGFVRKSEAPRLFLICIQRFRPDMSFIALGLQHAQAPVAREPSPVLRLTTCNQFHVAM